MSRTCIMARIDCALEKLRARQMAVRAIYLDEVDDAALVKANTRFWRGELGSTAIFHPTEYEGHPLRKGNSSIIYSTHGVGVTIPKRLSAKVAA